MRILPYYIFHTFINSIKKLFKTWVAVFIAVCFAFGLIVGILAGVLGSTIEDSMSSSYEEVIVEEEEVYEDTPLTPEEKKEMLSFIRGAIILVSFAVIVFSIYGGDKSGTKIFTMPDVNFLFASPLPPQTVLMFKTILQMGVAILTSVYLLFQLPNLVINVGLSVVTCLCIFAAVGFLLYFSRLAAVVTYTVATTNPKLKPWIRPFVVALFVLLIGAFALTSYLGGINAFELFLKVFSGASLEYIPIFGWLAGMIMASVDGSILRFSVYLILLILAAVVFTVLIWKIKADFYEDALSGANQMQEMLDAAQAGTTVKQRKKERSQRISRNGEFKSEGAKIFLEKIIYNRRRFAKFGILSNTAITYSLITIAATLGVKLLFKAETVLPVGFILLVCIFFRNFGNPLAAEMEHHFIYTVPEPPSKKLWYNLIGTSIETALDLVPVYVIIAFVLPELSVKLIVWFVLWISLDLFCSSVGLFIELAMPSSLVPAIKTMFAMFIRMFTAVPGLIMLIFAAAMNIPVLYFITIAINVIFAVILTSISPLFLHSGKK